MFTKLLCVAALLSVSACVCGPKGEKKPTDRDDDYTPSAIVVPQPQVGYLIVHTERTLSHADDVQRWLHTPYDVYDEAGQRVRHVENSMSFSDEAPSVVELPPGRYLVRTSSPRVSFPALIATGRTFEVDAVATARR